jgi:D-alanyl-D-alanine dipeptidase
MKDLVLIDKDNFDVELDLRYASKNNVTGEAFYDKAVCYLHKDAAKCLSKAIELAKIQGYKLKIFDGFRPLKAQKFLFGKFTGGGFVSNPDGGCIPHCRGIAVDLTLIDKDGCELDMGIGFDNFTKKAYHGDVEVSVEAQKNRFILMGIMMSSGWDFYQNEWWHYQLFNPRSYEIVEGFDF